MAMVRAVHLALPVTGIKMAMTMGETGKGRYPASVSIPSPQPQSSSCKQRRPLLFRRRAVAAAAASTSITSAVEEEEEELEAASMAMPRLKIEYMEKIVPALIEEFKYKNRLEIPKVKKIVVNCGLGDANQNAKKLEAAIKETAVITGQRPYTTRSKRDIAGFKIRAGMPVGIAVTLRGNIMYNFLDRLINLALPRTRDFDGIDPYSFDGHGNFNLGITEQYVFPEIVYETKNKARGMEVCITTSAKTDSEAQKLLSLMGMPFREGASVNKRKAIKWGSRW